MKKNLIGGVVMAAALLAGGPAFGLIYLPANSLESMLVYCPDVVIATIENTDAKADTATVKVDKSLKGELAGAITVKGLMLRVTREKKKPRFADKETAILFLTGSREPGSAGHTILHSQVLATEADRKAMEGCVAEIRPDAPLLADLANPRANINETQLAGVLKRLLVSDNAFTQILVGRLMGTSLPDRMKPDDDVLFLALLWHRKEVKKGALAWAKKYTELPRKVRVLLEELATDPNAGDLAKEAKELLKAHEKEKKPEPKIPLEK